MAPVPPSWQKMRAAFIDFHLTDICSQPVVVIDKLVKFFYECWLIFLLTLMSKAKMTQSCMLECHLSLNGVSDFLVEMNDSFQILKKCF